MDAMWIQMIAMEIPTNNFSDKRPRVNPRLTKSVGLRLPDDSVVAVKRALERNEDGRWVYRPVCNWERMRTIISAIPKSLHKLQPGAARPPPALPPHERKAKKRQQKRRKAQRRKARADDAVPSFEDLLAEYKRDGVY